MVEVAAGADAPVTVRAGPPSHLAGRVIDLVTGAPVAGVRCTVAPFLADAGIAWFGTEAPPTDAAGRRWKPTRVPTMRPGRSTASTTSAPPGRTPASAASAPSGARACTV